MLQSWTMAPPKLEGIHERGGVPVEIESNPLQFLANAGYTGIVATNSEFEIERYPRVGDEITAETVFETISDEKKTAMGNGFFVTWITTYRDQNGEVIGRQRFRTLRFKTGTLMTDRGWHRIDQSGHRVLLVGLEGPQAVASSDAATARRCGCRRGRCAATASR